MNVIDRQAKVLRLLATGSYSGLALREIARQLDLASSTTHRLLQALTEVGMVTQDEDSQNYRIGGEILYLAGTYLERMAFTDLVAPYLDRLTAETGLVSFSAVKDRDTVICTAVRTPRETTNFYVRVGKVLPLHASAAAKALIYPLDLPQLSAILSESSARRYTDNTLASAENLAKDLESGLQRGYWECNEEFEPDVYAVAAPILSADAQPMASLAVVGRLGMVRGCLDQIKSCLTDSTSDASREIGQLLYSGQLTGAA
ncbi:MAG TPA: IclR family transcriptional regulator [Trueperaceae bacterium]